MQTATNPQTGETVVLVGDKWAKADSVASNDKGEKAYLVSGKWLSEGDASLPDPAKPRGVGSELLRQAGLTVRAGVQGLTGIPNMFGNAFGLHSTESVDNALNAIGLPKPETATERVAQDVAGALAGTGGIAKVAQAASPASSMGRGVADALAVNLGTQAGASVAGSGAAGVTREMGGGPGSQLAAGLLGGVALPMAGQAATRAVPNMIAKSVAKSEATPFAKEGERLANETGIDLTLGQRSGNKLALNMENAARQYPPLADRVQDIDVKIANQAIQRVEKIADTISKTKTAPAELGTQMEDTVKTAALKLDTMRDSMAGRDYGKVRELAGDKPVIKLSRFVDELRSIVDEYKNVPGSDAQKAATQAQAAIDRITGTTTPAQSGGKVISTEGAPLMPGSAAKTGTIDNTISEAMRARRFYGKAARGGANVFEDIAPDMNRTLAARLFGAINKDFDESATNAGGALRQALDTANGNYKKVSQSLEYLEKSAIGKMVGEDLVDAALSGTKISSTAGEAIVNKLMSSHPSTRKTAIDILEKHNPQLAKDTRAFVLRDALDKAMSLPPSVKGASQIPLSTNRFISALQGDKVSFSKQLESYGFGGDEIKDIMSTVQAMARAGDRTGFNSSGTNVQGQAMEIAGAMGAAATGNIKGAASKALSIGGKYIGLSKFADAMESAKGRAAIRTLVSTQASPQAVVAAFETVENK